MVFSYMKTKLILFKASPSFYSNRISPSNYIPGTPLQNIIFSARLTTFHLVSAVSLLGVRSLRNSHGFIVGTRRFYHSNPSQQAQRTFKALVKLSEREKQPLARAFLWASSRKWTAGEVIYTIIIGSCLLVLIFGGKIERVPYSKRFQYAASDKLEKMVGKIQWKMFEKEDGKEMLLQSDPRVIRVASIARNILQAMNEGLMLQNQYNIIAHNSESSMLLDHKLQNFGPINEAMVEQNRMNRTPKLIWKPATKHLDGKVWEVRVTDSYSDNAFYVDGKIVVQRGLLGELESDAELATVIAHEIGHAVARHSAERFMRAVVMLTLLFLLYLPSEGSSPPHGLDNLFRLVESFFSRRREAEADYIGLMLMAAAGYDPKVAPDVYEKLDGSSSETNLITELNSTHYSGEKRAKLLKKPKTMELAKQIYEEVKAGYGIRSFVQDGCHEMGFPISQIPRAASSCFKKLEKMIYSPSNALGWP